MTAVLEVSAADAARLLETGQRLLDVREPDEWAAGHVAEAVHIPLGQLVARAGELDRSTAWLVICRRGGRSLTAAEHLAGAGYSVTNVEGGMQRWAEADLPMVSADGGAAEVI